MAGLTVADVQGAARRLAGHAIRTPLLENAALNERAGGRILCKPECLQHAGSFKFRGAFNRLSQLAPDERRRGVVAWSSGNHAQGVAAAARRVGTAATIVMPRDAPRAKIDGTRQLGADIVFYDRYCESREEIARRLAEESGATLVPSFDDYDVIAGQGTVGLEIMEDAQASGFKLDAVLVCCGGGGLAAGTATAINGIDDSVEIFSVEPEGFDDTARSLVAGERLSIDPQARSICDALLTPSPGELTFPINHSLLAGGLVVSDAEVRSAMVFAFVHLKLVLEPGGAVALAAILAGRVSTEDKQLAIVLSGGNVDPELFASVIAEGS